MTLDELYPYWDDSHQEFLEVVGGLKEWQLETVPGPGGRSLHQILLDFIRAERYWVGHLVNGYPEYRPQAEDFPDGPALAEALKATRAVSAQVLDPLGVDGLRAVRTVPGDPATNRYENQPAHRLAVLAGLGAGTALPGPNGSAFGRRKSAWITS